MDGIVIVDKPQDWTSQDVVSKLRGVFRTRRIGHGGTLDPMATGVLPVFVGRATRGVEFFEHAEKIYEAELLLGTITDTEDVTGRVLEKRTVSVTREELEDILSRFRGELSQIPPMYSAIKVNGQKLYDLARKGQEVERKPRKITIFSLECLAFDGRAARLRVHCSKGTYIRTLCKDIGEALGCGGCMAALRRVQAGEYDLSRAVTLETLTGCENPGGVSAAGGQPVCKVSGGDFDLQPGKALPQRQCLFRDLARGTVPGLQPVGRVPHAGRRGKRHHDHREELFCCINQARLPPQ